MTQEEKAKAYDEALKIARCWLNDPQTIQDCNYTIEDAIQNIFPVLAKSEDEMIRKELINWINGKTTYEWSYEWCENKDRWIAYLEKQKENPDRVNLIGKAKSEKQVVLLTESNGNENIYWDTKSEEDAVSLLEKGLKFFGKQKPAE